MNEQTLKKLGTIRHELKTLGSVIVAYSGGVDSSLLMKIALDTLGRAKTLAVTARSGAYPQTELVAAIELAESIGAEHRVIESDELNNADYSANPPNRCYYCKGELFSKLSEIADKEGYNAVLDGSNADDLGDHRPGATAAMEKGTRSPLQSAGLTKKEIRALARKMGLANWDKPARACLASRFPYGEKITAEKLKMVENAEEKLHQLGFRQVRVRHHGAVARVELPPSDIPRAVTADMAARIHSSLKEAGFIYTAVDIPGYRSGSMNEAIPSPAKDTKEEK